MSRRLLTTLLAGALLVLSAAGLQPASAATGKSRSALPGTLVVQSQPPLPGVGFSADGNTAWTDGNGIARLHVRNFTGLASRLGVLASTPDARTRVVGLRLGENPDHGVNGAAIVIGVSVERLVSLAFIDRSGAPVALAPGSAVTLTDSLGGTETLSADQAMQPVWLPANHPVAAPGQGIVSADVHYSVSSVDLGGTPGVARDQQRFDAMTDSTWVIRLTPPRPHPKNARKLPGVLSIEAVPPLAGVPFGADGATAVSDATGSARLPVHAYAQLSKRLVLPNGLIDPDTRVAVAQRLGNPDQGQSGKTVVYGLNVSRRVSWQFVDGRGDPVSPGEITQMRLRSNLGAVVTVRGSALGEPLWVVANHVVHSGPRLVSRDAHYAVESVTMGGVSVVATGQQRFEPMRNNHWTVHLLVFPIQVSAHDALFGGPVGSGVQVSAPDGHVLRVRFTGTSVYLPSVTRGSYQLRALASGYAVTVPVRISGRQVISLPVFTPKDGLAVFGPLLALAVGLVLLRRPRLRRRLRPRPGPLIRWVVARRWPRAHRPVRLRRLAAALVVAALLLAPLAGSSSAHAAEPTTPRAGDPALLPIPVLAYHYIWFSTDSWNRAKKDYPLIGRYSSDDPKVMQTQIAEAQAAGITGFLVSWKHTATLDRRLNQLATLAAARHFALGVVYEALDFTRHPLPVTTVTGDLLYFAQHFAPMPAFRLFGRPLVVWTGTGQYSTADVAAVATAFRPSGLLLASAKNVADYQRVAPFVDGEAYYWSSADPLRTPGYGGKLQAFSAAVHAHHQLWIAPAAPGFDARLIGGHSVVPRRNGQTLAVSLHQALDSSPDALGVISWNEFSENTYIEPSVHTGDVALRTLRQVLAASAPAAPGDSSNSATTGGIDGTLASGILGGIAVTGILLLIAVRRARRVALGGGK